MLAHTSPRLLGVKFGRSLLPRNPAAARQARQVPLSVSSPLTAVRTASSLRVTHPWISPLQRKSPEEASSPPWRRPLPLAAAAQSRRYSSALAFRIAILPLQSLPLHHRVVLGSKAILHRPFSKDAKGNPDETAASNPPTAPKDAPPPSSTSSEPPHPSRMESLRTEAREQLVRARQNVTLVEERLKQVATGDQLAVAAIFLLLTGLIAAPYVVSQMKASTRNYDGIADTDDPVDDFTKLALGGWEHADDEEGSGKATALENLLSEVVRSKALQQAARQFVIQIVEAPEVQAALRRLLLVLWKDLVEDPETVQQVIHLLSVAIQDEAVKAAAQKLVLDLVQEEDVRQSLVQAVEQLGQEEQVQQSLQVLLTNTAHHTLNDGEILDHSMEFATDVLGDDVVQQSAGEALRNTVRHAFRPTATMGLTATGVALIFFGIFALGYARSSEIEAQLLDTAARSLQANAAHGLQRLVTWPGRMLGNLAAVVAGVGRWTAARGGQVGSWVAARVWEAQAGAVARGGRLWRQTLVVLPQWGHAVGTCLLRFPRQAAQGLGALLDTWWRRVTPAT